MQGVFQGTADTKKTSFDGFNKYIRFGGSSMRGWRLAMEDAHIADQYFTANSSLFAVFDGHGGNEVAKFCSNHFGKLLRKNKKFLDESDIPQALEDTFFALDEMLLDPIHDDELFNYNEEHNGTNLVGCTANVVIIQNNIIYCANAGDSRSVLYQNSKKVVALSKDHKPENNLERERIEKAGGHVSFGRVCGNLSLSRSIGDFEYKKRKDLNPKKQIVTAFPDLHIHHITPSDAFIVMGCDGVWEMQTEFEICNHLDTGFKKGLKKFSMLTEQVLDKSVGPNRKHGKGCDNMTCIVIKINAE